MVYMTGGMQTALQQTPASAQVPVVVAAIGGWRKSGLGGGSSLSTGAWPRRAQPSVSVRIEHGGDMEMLVALKRLNLILDNDIKFFLLFNS